MGLIGRLKPALRFRFPAFQSVETGIGLIGRLKPALRFRFPAFQSVETGIGLIGRLKPALRFGVRAFLRFAHILDYSIALVSRSVNENWAGVCSVALHPQSRG